jgi:hypothetical protein
MNRRTASSDRTALIRLAYSLPQGSPERRSLLEGLVRSAKADSKVRPKTAKARDLSLQVDLPSYSPSNWKEFLERPLQALLKDPAYQVYVVGGVGDVPYLVIQPQYGALEAEFIPAIMRDFNPLVRKIVELFREKGTRVSAQDVVNSIARNSPKLVQALREAKR